VTTPCVLACRDCGMPLFTICIQLRAMRIETMMICQMNIERSVPKNSASNAACIARWEDDGGGPNPILFTNCSSGPEARRIGRMPPRKIAAASAETDLFSEGERPVREKFHGVTITRRDGAMECIRTQYNKSLDDHSPRQIELSFEMNAATQSHCHVNMTSRRTRQPLLSRWRHH